MSLGSNALWLSPDRRLSAGRAQFAAERSHQRPTIDVRGVVSANQTRVVIRGVEGEGPDKTGVAQWIGMLLDLIA